MFPTRIPNKRSRIVRFVALPAVLVMVAFGLTSCKATPVFRGYGMYVDTYDWSPTVTGGRPAFGVNNVDDLANAGVQTLFIQTSRANQVDDIVDRPLLEQIISRARSRGIDVVGWYLPEHLDPATDLRRLQAIATLDVQGIGANIESWKNTNVPERSARAVELSAQLRASTSLPLIAIVVPPYVYEVLNGNAWPNFPYKQMDPYYDAWSLMTYWTNRRPGTEGRDPFFYITDNVRRLRENLGRPGYEQIHISGGIGNLVTAEDLNAQRRALVQTKAMGAAMYDWVTLPAQYRANLLNLRDFRDGQPAK